MLTVMIGTKKVTIRKMTTSLNKQHVENVLLEYVGRRAVKNIATAVMKVVGDNQIIVEIQNNMYKLVLNNGVPSFEEYILKGNKGNLAKVLIEKGFIAADAIECVNSMIATTLESNQTNKPSWIPEGYEYYTGNLGTGFVVRDKKGNEFTYMPKTGDFISRYEISKGDDGVTPMSVPGRPAWADITQDEAIEVARSFAPNCNSDLIEDYEYWKKMCEFISNKIGKSLVYDDSTLIGAYSNNGGEVYTGENPAFMVYNIDCLAGNHCCMTKKKFQNDGVIDVCGGSYSDYSDNKPMASHCHVSLYYGHDTVGFRIVLKRSTVHCSTV